VDQFSYLSPYKNNADLFFLAKDITLKGRKMGLPPPFIHYLGFLFLSVYGAGVREEHKLRVLDNRVSRRIFGPK
jgi:hypothetical protein